MPDIEKRVEFSIQGVVSPEQWEEISGFMGQLLGASFQVEAYEFGVLPERPSELLSGVTADILEERVGRATGYNPALNAEFIDRARQREARQFFAKETKRKRIA